MIYPRYGRCIADCAVAGGAMASRVEYYHKLLREINGGTTTRDIEVEVTAGIIQVVISEVRAKQDTDGYIIGYDFHLISQRWFMTFKEAISAAEVSFQSSLKSGFYEVVVVTSAGNQLG